MEDAFREEKKMNFLESLIREVEKKPLLWNRYANDYNNRSAMDNEWENIAITLKKDKDFVKQKWRNLRDQFQRESKKVKVPFDNPTKPYIQYYRGKWIYFEHLLFLKDVTIKRNSTCYSTSEEFEIHEDDIKQETIEFEDDILAEHVNDFKNEFENNIRDSSVTSPSIEATLSTNIIQPKDETVDEQTENEELEEIGRKRKASEMRSESIAFAKSKRTSLVEATSQTEERCEIDDDLHFVKSLVPYLRKLSPVRKLLVRNEIHNLLIRESLCNNCKLGKSSLHNA